jgi:hypothetical protein
MSRAGKIRLRYTIMGLAIGTFWFLGRDRPAWEEAIRVIIVFTILIIIFRALLGRRGIRIRLAPILVTKITLIVVAAGVETLLGLWVPGAGVYVAIGLALVIGVGGPRFDRHLFVYEHAERAPQEVPR